MTDPDNKLARGIYYNQPRDGAPDYVIAGLSFRRADFIGWLNAQEDDAKGYVKVDILRAKSGKLYAKLNDWKPDANRDTGRQAERAAAQPPARTVDEATGEEVDACPF